MDLNHYTLILSGGKGSRFWPISNLKKPKQFIDLMGTGESLLQKTYKRVSNLSPVENIFISTNNNYKSLAQKQLPQFIEENILTEPSIQNTAPCILYAAMKIYKKNPNAIMLVVPSDHWIEDTSAFYKSINYGLKVASKKDILITLGISPSYPHTGYGYIKFDTSKSKEKKVNLFSEKPNFKTAKKFLFEGNYLWNAGIFIWKASTIIESFKQYQSDLYELFKSGEHAYNTIKEKVFIEENYRKAKNISIDFAILEQASNIYTIPTICGWTDLGSWKSLFQKKSTSPAGNVIMGGQAHIKKSKGNIIFISENKKVIVKGLKNYVVSETKEHLLIYPLDDDQEIKTIVKNLDNGTLSSS